MRVTLLLLIFFKLSISFGQSVDSVFTQKDTLINDTTKGKVVKMAESNDVKETVNYHAKDSIFMDVIRKKAYLYGDAHVDYGRIVLDAAYIEIDWDKSEVFAKGMEDSTGKTVGMPVFQEGEETFTAREMRYNFKTEKGIIHEVVTQEGEGFIHGTTVKMNEDKELFIGDAVYTTCNLEHPHFAIKAKKIKIVPDKVAVTGPFHLTIADVPTPLGFAFGLFPFPKEKSSGIVLPTYGESPNRGFFLQNGGFYWAVNDYVGTTITGDIYTNGSWRMNWETDYKKRYSYEGNTIIALARNKSGFDVPEEPIPYGYRVYWKHSPQGKANSRLTSSVDIKSANYNRNNMYNPNAQLRNSFSSAVTYNKKFGKSPFSLTTALRQDQTDSIQNYTLPDVTFNMQRIFPLKKLGDNPKAWYSTLGVGYTAKARNKVTNLDNVVVDGISKRRIEEIDFLDMQSLMERSDNGIQHTIPIILPKFKLFKYLNFTPTANYDEYWYGKSLQLGYDTTTNSVVREDTIRGFNRLYKYSYNASMTTRMFGYWDVGLLGLERIKHTLNPSIGFTYNPDFSDERFGFYDSFENSQGREVRFSRYQGFAMGGPGQGENQRLNFSVSNVFEAKLRSRKDTVTGFQYVKLLENLGLSSSYNFAADSFNLAPLSVNGRTTIKGINIQFGSNYNFYKIRIAENGTVYRVNNFIWNANELKVARMTAANLAVSTNLNPKKRRKKYDTGKEEDQLDLEFINNNIDDYVDFDIPWSLRIGYNLNLNRQFFSTTVSQSITLRGDLSLTPKWKITWNSGYDLVNQKMTPTRLSLIRDLHCWEMRFNWVPFGFQKSYSFDINVKASVLQDLKLSKKDRFNDR